MPSIPTGLRTDCGGNYCLDYLFDAIIMSFGVFLKKFSFTKYFAFKNITWNVIGYILRMKIKISHTENLELNNTTKIIPRYSNLLQ